MKEYLIKFCIAIAITTILCIVLFGWFIDWGNTGIQVWSYSVFGSGIYLMLHEWSKKRKK